MGASDAPAAVLAGSRHRQLPARRRALPVRAGGHRIKAQIDKLYPDKVLPIMDAIYGYQALNVEAQQRNAGSFLQWDQADDRDPQAAPGLSAWAGARS